LIALGLAVASVVLFAVYVSYGAGRAAEARLRLDGDIDNLARRVEDPTLGKLVERSQGELERADSFNQTVLLPTALLLAYGALVLLLAGHGIAWVQARRAAAAAAEAKSGPARAPQ
jgi:hypothetical protein